jgi:hypothetical protein
MKLRISNRERIRSVTPDSINRMIDREIENNIRKYTYQGSYEIGERIGELEREWDIERVLQIGASSASFVGIGLSFRNRNWLIVPAVITSFLVMQALKGWAPPIPILRRFGFRTKQEIECEIFAMKHLRGDFTEFEKVAKRDADIAIKEAMATVNT